MGLRVLKRLSVLQIQRASGPRPLILLSLHGRKDQRPLQEASPGEQGGGGGGEAPDPSSFLPSHVNTS